jgi:dynactin-6
VKRAGTILQPRCTIVAAAGPIIFGQNNVVEELAVIVNRHKEPLIIGDCNLFEVGCRAFSFLSPFFFSAVLTGERGDRH